MVTIAERLAARRAAADLMRQAGIPVSREEEERIEVADFGLSNLLCEGAQILTWVQTNRIGVKVIALLPRQALPEHWHPPVGEDVGKEETVRLIWGDLLIYTDGTNTLSRGSIPGGKTAAYSCRHEMSPAPGEQVTFEPGEKHWFLAGPRGAVAYSFSSAVRDIVDQFTDPDVKRITEITE